jgi:hypothetical protein
LFKFENGFVVNERGKRMQVAGNLDNENRNIEVTTDKNGKAQQMWQIVYADEYPDEPTKGQLNKKYGLYVERDFYIVSELGQGRYMDLINNRNMVIKTQNGRKTQVWYFHQQS